MIYRRLIKVIGSIRLMAILFIAFALSMAIGTFIENSFSIDVARIYIYDAWWFEGMMVLFVLNFLFNIRKYSLNKRSKWPTLMIHLAFVIIIIGAFITRYYGFTGLMSIREGSSSNKVISDETYLQLRMEMEEDGIKHTQQIEKQVLLSQATAGLNPFAIQTEFNGKDIGISYDNFIENAQWSFSPSNGDAQHIKIVETHDGERHDHYIKEGEILHCGHNRYTFNNPQSGSYNFSMVANKLWLDAPLPGKVLHMLSGDETHITAGYREPIKFKALYDFGELKFVVPERAKRGKLSLLTDGTDIKQSSGPHALVLTLTIDGRARPVVVFGKRGKVGNPTQLILDGISYSFSYGSKTHLLPFKIKLHKFIAKKYPGTTNSYASFESKVKVLDDSMDMDAEIYMNHVLDYKGYRFFQSSFHPDERGTILSVNHDYWGTQVTYIGYFLLYLGLLAILFSKNSRFGHIVKQLKKLNSSSKSALLVVLLLSAFHGFGQQEIDPIDPMVLNKLDSIVTYYKVPDAHAQKFARLVIQDVNGRMKPMDTYASELLRKISKDDRYKDLNANQAVLSMLQFPDIWINMPLVYIKSGNDSLRAILETPKGMKRVPLAKFFDKKGNYKLQEQVGVAYKAIVPNQFEKDFIEVDRRVNLLYNALNGNDLRIFPVPNDKNNTWISTLHLSKHDLQRRDSLFVANILPLYFNTFSEEIRHGKGDFGKSYGLLGQIEKYQNKFGHDIIPERSKINWEIRYNKYDIFKNLFSWYLVLGMLLLIMSVIGLFKRNKSYDMTMWIPRVGIYLCFALHTLGLLARWYVSGHAPWSDAYESIIYISWATMLFGIILGRKFDLALAATAFVNAMILMVAHWNWLDPAIANLQPVLNSYWLMIHVAIIVASYGPFTLGMVLSVLALLLMSLVQKTNQAYMRKAIKKLVLLTEMSLTIGLVMLTIGNFLGGQWANESWGRYWAWDPKETWALISILVYAFIIHMRLVPGLRGKWLFSLMGVLGFYAILMTYFGVNFYLSGLHSYAQGDNIVTPRFLYYSIAAIVILASVSLYKQMRYRI